MLAAAKTRSLDRFRRKLKYTMGHEQCKDIEETEDDDESIDNDGEEPETDNEQPNVLSNISKEVSRVNELMKLRVA